MKKTCLLIFALLAYGVSFSQAQASLDKKSAPQPKTSTKNAHLSKSRTAAKKSKYVHASPQIKDCPPNFVPNNGCIYDPDGKVKYVIENSYTGNYPETDIPLGDVSARMPSKSLTVTSPAFKNFELIPSKYTCDGQQASPPLAIGNVPPETRSLAVVMYDPLASEHGSETYWLMWDLDTSGLIPENFVSDHMAMNAAGEYGYHAVCPKSGTHYYHFMAYAVDVRMKGNKHLTRSKLEKAISGHVLAKGELVGVYEKHLDVR